MISVLNKIKKATQLRGLFFKKRLVVTNYFFTSSLAASTACFASSTFAAAVSTAAAAVSTAAAAVSTASTAVESAATSALASACLQDTTVNAAITAKLKNTFFILLNYKRLIINSRQRYKFFNRLKLFFNFFFKNLCSTSFFTLQQSCQNTKKC